MQTASELQEGIYYTHKEYPRASLAILLLRVRQHQSGVQIQKTLSGLWEMYSKLKKGWVSGIRITEKNPNLGSLSVLFGYGPKFFDIAESQRTKPAYLKDQWLFQSPGLGGTPIVPNTGLRYADDITANEVANDHLLIQFIGNTQLATHQAVVETWKFLRSVESKESYAAIDIRTFFTGFNRPDNRSWLGFHDGLSNIKSSERLRVILVDKNNLSPNDYWTTNGTYLAFLRIAIEMSIWETIPEIEQEKIVGRNKQTGCPIVGQDRGKNVYAANCPVEGTSHVTDRGNEQYREYPFKSAQKHYAQVAADSIHESHIQRMRKIPDQIFRQGYEFLEPTETHPYFRVGLNFVSFQGGTDKIYRNIRYGFNNINFGGAGIPGADKLLQVRAAGVFLVPPFKKDQTFPGEIIFEQKTTDPVQSHRIPIRYL